MLANVDLELAELLASDLGMEMPPAMPKALRKPQPPEVTSSAALSIFAHPNNGDFSTRRTAILVADGVDGDAAADLHMQLAAKGAVPRYVGPRLGLIKSGSGPAISVEVTFEATPSVLFDAVAIPGGDAAAKLLSQLGHALEFVKDQYRHAKPILVLGSGQSLLEKAGVKLTLASGKADPGILGGKRCHRKEDGFRVCRSDRHHERELDPPAV